MDTKKRVKILAYGGLAVTVADVWFREDHGPHTPEGNEGQGSVAPRGRHGSA